jgi:hypothetical protein
MSALVSFEHPLVIANAPLPIVYTAAQKALAECYAIDECRAWADKAAALESYARQSDDETLLNLAKRIKGRAIRRCGELLRQIEPPKFRGNQHEEVGDDTGPNRKQAASDAGLSERQRKQALRIANIPQQSFEQQIEADSPPTLTELAAQGTNKKPMPLFDLEGISPADFQVATKALGTVADLATMAQVTDPEQVARGMKANEKPTFCIDLDKALAWLTRLKRIMACTHTAIY